MIARPRLALAFASLVVLSAGACSRDAASPAEPATTDAIAAGAEAALPAGTDRRDSEFHSEQCGHWPCHFSDSPPQELHTNTDWLRATSHPGCRGSRAP